MGMAYTKMNENTMDHLVFNAGVLAAEFDPDTGVFNGLMGVTTGGVTFNTNPTYEDFAEDIDQAPNNMMEFKRKTAEDPTLSGNFVEITAALAKQLVAAGDIDSENAIKIIPRSELNTSDFKDVWFIADYSNVNTGSSAGYLAIHLMNALNQSGFQVTTSKNGKGQFAFEFHAHYSIAAQDTVPYEIYVKQGGTSENTDNGDDNTGGGD